MDVECAIDGPVTVGEKEVHANFSVTAKNIGNVPAVDVHVFGTAIRSGPFILAGPGAIERQLQKAELIEMVAKTIVLPGQSTTMGFPNAEVGFDQDTVARDEEMRRNNPGVIFPDYINITIVYGVRYRALGTSGKHHTVYLGSLHREQNRHFNIGDIVPASDLKGMVLSSYSRLT